MFSVRTITHFEAFENFMIVIRDRSNSAHNPTYVKALIADMETTLGII